MQLTAGVVAFRLEREPLRGLVLLPLQQIVYRQLMYAAAAGARTAPSPRTGAER